MKKTFFMLLALMAVAYSSYAQDGKKFIGNWEPTDYKILSKGTVIIIGKKGGRYTFSSSRKRETVDFDYSKKDDTLIGKLDGAFVIIRYLDHDKHILMMPQTHADPIQFKKTTYSQ